MTMRVNQVAKNRLQRCRSHDEVVHETLIILLAYLGKNERDRYLKDVFYTAREMLGRTLSGRTV